jgi:cytochrome oxidase Cu insertion factor (SCO1/SenC/PrrC family)
MIYIKKLIRYLLVILVASILVFFMLKFIKPFNSSQIDSINLNIVSEKIKIKKDKKIIAYFGSLECQDTISQVFSDIRDSMDKLSISDNNKFDILFIDTQRDDTNEVQSYVQYFIPKAKSVLINDDELSTIQKNNHILLCTKSLYLFNNISTMYKHIDLYDKNINLDKEIQNF